MIGKALTVISSRTDNCSHQNNTLLFGCELDCSRHIYQISTIFWLSGANLRVVLISILYREGTATITGVASIQGNTASHHSNIKATYMITNDRNSIVLSVMKELSLFSAL